MNAEKQIVVKSNALINAMCDLSLQGNRFLAFAISLLDRTKSEIGKAVELEIPVLNFAKAFGLDVKSSYREIEALADQFQRKIITLYPEQSLSGRRVKVGIITKQEYLDNEGRVFIRFDEDIVPHLLDLKEQFTEYRIKDVYQFSKVSSWRLYELLKQYKKIGKREIELDELKMKLGVSGKYNLINNLKQWIIKPAILEINETSDIEVQYDQKKRGRKIVGFVFYIIDNDKTKTEREKIRKKLSVLDNGEDKDPEFSALLRKEYKVSPKQAKELSNLVTYHQKTDKIKSLLPKIKKRYEALENKKTSLGGYVFKALHNELLPKLPLKELDTLLD